jgi:hypothetical protein
VSNTLWIKAPVDLSITRFDLPGIDLITAISASAPASVRICASQVAPFTTALS